MVVAEDIFKEIGMQLIDMMKTETNCLLMRWFSEIEVFNIFHREYPGADPDKVELQITQPKDANILYVGISLKNYY